jgi:hypothetical protein
MFILSMLIINSILSIENESPFLIRQLEFCIYFCIQYVPGLSLQEGKKIIFDFT